VLGQPGGARLKVPPLGEARRAACRHPVAGPGGSWSPAISSRRVPFLLGQGFEGGGVLVALRPATLDAVIVGGGPAGLSAALVLGRARRRVLVLDTDRPASAPSNAVGGLLAQVGVAPAELRRAGREQLADHPTVELRRDEVLDVERTAEGLSVSLDGGPAARTRALVLAHGLRYDPPALPGVEAL
jgi:NADPH-dependent 2,4-dienoyl-CoA reductase/sulfur reductase-like enzyme